MGKIIAENSGYDLDDLAVMNRNNENRPRKEKSIGFSSVRCGDIIGEHTAIFAMDSERIELTHKSSSRSNYAAGALKASNWIAGKKSGFYSMKDIL